ncbi:MULTISPECIES: hypothetical protein [unclassified Pseudomonas]|uniref:hypothetical protein n=1 Tax=unclassified Pseudomonas TaxID=196821 RepID=UPI00119D7E4D|nr:MULTISPECIES: hypothetical protein [unclassified Pseudomonas]
MNKLDAIRITAQLNACGQALRSLRAYDQGAARRTAAELYKLRLRAEFQYNALKALQQRDHHSDPELDQFNWLLASEDSSA